MSDPNKKPLKQIDIEPEHDIDEFDIPPDDDDFWLDDIGEMDLGNDFGLEDDDDFYDNGWPDDDDDF